MKKILTLSATLLAAAIALAGCSTDTGTGGMSGMNHGASASPGMGASAAVADHNSADTMFAQAMIPHHAQAVEMSTTILAKQGIDPRVGALATTIKAAQAPEIEKMTEWLTGWGEPTAMAAGHSMTGMMSTDDMAKLDAAQGTEAAKLFLSQMVAHHEGALAMAQTETADGRNPDAVALAKSIVSSQKSEIKDMKDLLATL
ncbi:DUF305 domain-containing protein [Pseudarthrobacter sp. P1]|uniref:DUF305 domain-containing protein n=1 Tax=Pseudarthrobacter sp. P1 TaxID=3418418 RepID=UPI003CE9AA2F